jgi:hypothetical protein
MSRGPPAGPRWCRQIVKINWAELDTTRFQVRREGTEGTGGTEGIEADTLNELARECTHSVTIVVHSPVFNLWPLLIAREFVRFQVLTVASMKMAIFWVAAPYSLVEV